MPVLEVQDVRKAYGPKIAVEGVSFSVEKGQVLGLLGPNGAGKTSLIRMIMDIIRPDSGEIKIFGETLSPGLKHRLGYLPEERGLYQKQKVFDVLVFLGQLKGLTHHVATVRTERYLDRVGLLEVKKKRMRELSRGMQQKVQIAAVLLHEPELLILDEPFSGLDPINRSLIIEIMKELSGKGTTLILSTHLMDQVQALCERIVLVNQGKAVLEGDVRETQKKYADNALLIETDRDLEGHPDIKRQETSGHGKKVWLIEGLQAEAFIGKLIQEGASIRQFERALPTLDEIFVKAVSP
jgi:ABC-2 type transport system ATP-binding protein